MLGLRKRACPSPVPARITLIGPSKNNSPTGIAGPRSASGTMRTACPTFLVRITIRTPFRRKARLARYMAASAISIISATPAA
jgi:hypothetical protein